MQKITKKIHRYICFFVVFLLVCSVFSSVVLADGWFSDDDNDSVGVGGFFSDLFGRFFGDGFFSNVLSRLGERLRGFLSRFGFTVDGSDQGFDDGVDGVNFSGDVERDGFAALKSSGSSLVFHSVFDCV
jgi:hypothetical protein